MRSVLRARRGPGMPTPSRSRCSRSRAPRFGARRGCRVGCRTRACLMLIGSRSGRSRSEPPLATFCSACRPGGRGHWRPASAGTLRGLRSAAVDDRDVILRSLLEERTVDIVTTGRRSKAARTTEIWTTVVDGQTCICGTPNASRPGVEHQPRDWLANLVATPEFIVRLKTSVHVDLPATAVRVDDSAERGVCSPLPRPSTTAARCHWRPPSPTVRWCGCSSREMPPGWMPRSAPGGPRSEPFGRIPAPSSLAVATRFRPRRCTNDVPRQR